MTPAGPGSRCGGGVRVTSGWWCCSTTTRWRSSTSTGTGPVTVDVDVTGTGELAVVRPELDDDEPAVHGVSCRGDDGIATQVASGLVMVAVLASAVAVLPRRHRSVTLDS